MARWSMLRLLVISTFILSSINATKKIGYEMENLLDVPQLSKKDRVYLSQIEDAMTSRKGGLLYTNSWAVELHPSQVATVDKIAKKHGFVNAGRVGNLDGFFHFKRVGTAKRSRRSSEMTTKKLLMEDGVLWAQQQHVLDRKRKSVIFNDPKFKDQWYLKNEGQSTGPKGVDINVLPVWQEGITGKGVVVSVLDDGIDHTHPDLKGNFDQRASYDFNDMDSNPMPRDSDPDNCHGTRCAGEIAAMSNNSVCGVGVAYDVRIGGVRMLDGQATDIIEGSALSFQSDYIDIYSNCWGPKDDGKTFGKPGRLAQEALLQGALKGRNGKGNIYVWATGNGGLTDDDCNCDGYTTSIYTISIGCISDHGLSAYYTELCSSTLAVTFNGGSHREREENKVVTTDLHHTCTEEFKGTSSSAPLAAGVFALVLQANPSLGWRDIQHIVVHTAQVTSPIDPGWSKNGAGFHFNHKFGFGRLDASRMVDLAKKWKNVLPQRKCEGPSSSSVQEIPAGGTLSVTIDTVACDGTDHHINQLEHVTLTVSLQHRRRGDLSIDLFSPYGTRNELLSTRRYDDSDKGLHDWSFMTVHCWGENPKGVWILNITDNIAYWVSKGYRISSYPQHDTSRQQPDLEDLEEEVIDEEKNLLNITSVGPKNATKGLATNLVRDSTLGSKNAGTKPRTSDSYIEDYKLSMQEQRPASSSQKRKSGRILSPKTGLDAEVQQAGAASVRSGGDSPDRKKSLEYSLAQEGPSMSEDENASQRVQVSNGFSEPFSIGYSQKSGRIASGLLLEWRLTFYGTD